MAEVVWCGVGEVVAEMLWMVGELFVVCAKEDDGWTKSRRWKLKKTVVSCLWFARKKMTVGRSLAGGS